MKSVLDLQEIIKFQIDETLRHFTLDVYFKLKSDNPIMKYNDFL